MKKINVLFFVFAVLFFASLISAYTISNYDYSAGSITSSSYYSTGLSYEDCSGGSDFVVQIEPFSCEPAPVTSDLLEEESVTVYCKIVATQVNPFIDVDSISYISITGEYSSAVQSVGYFPSESALGYWSDGSLDNLALNDLGYVAITLRQNSNESSMPDYVTGTLKAKLKYDIENSFGVGNVQYYLPVLDDGEFEANSAKYSFWDGRGYVRATSIGEDEATIVLYTNSFQKMGSVQLEKGETSNEMYISGLNPCLATLKVRLNSLENPDTRVKLKVNSDYVEVGDEESFLDSACKVKSITKNGINQEVKIYCKGDEKSGTYELRISPKVTLEVDGVTDDYELGDWLHSDSEKAVYLGYIGSKGDSTKEEDLFVVLVARPLTSLSEEGLSSSELSSIAEQMNLAFSDVDSGASVLDFLGNYGSKLLGATVSAGKWVVAGQEYQAVEFASSSDFRNVKVAVESFAIAQDAELFSLEEVFYSVDNSKIKDDSGEEVGLDLDYSTSGTPRILLKNSEKDTVGIFYGEDCDVHDDCGTYTLSETGLVFEKGDYEGFFDGVVEGVYRVSSKEFVLKKAVKGDSGSDSAEYYSNAMEDYETLVNSYASQTTDTESETYGERGLYEAIYLSYSLGQMKTMLELCQEFEEDYSDSNKIENIKSLCEDKYKTSNSELSSLEIQINDDVKIISFEGVYEPSYEEYGAEVLVKGANGELRTYELKKGKKVYLYGLSEDSEEGDSTNEYMELISVDEDSAKIKVNALKESTVSDLLETNTKTLDIDESDNFGSNYVFTLVDTNIQQNAKVTIVPSFNYQDSESEFNFSIGIEKRTILLSDEKIKQRIEFLNNTMKTFENIVGGLDTFNRALGGVCLATGGYLTLKNLIANSDGSAIARNEIMNGKGGWTERCNQKVAKGEYTSLEDCFYDNADEIDAQVEEVQEVISGQNSIIKNLQELNSNNGVINKLSFTKDYSSEVSDSLKGVGTSISNSNGDETISIQEVTELLDSSEAIKQGIFDSQDLKDVQLYAELYSDAASGSNEKTSYGDKLYSSLTDLMTNAKSFNLAQDLKEESGLENSFVMDVDSAKKTTEVTINEHETFGSSEYGSYGFATGSTKVGNDEYVAVIVGKGSGNTYLLVYSDEKINKGVVKATYLISTVEKTLTIYGKKDEQTGQVEPNPLKLYFKKVQSENLKNEYLNPEIVYYESGSYDEYPSLVPLDKDEGWYVGIKDSDSGVAAYDASGKVRIIWLCNVGSNGLEEFSLYSNSYGDDVCQQYDLTHDVVTFSGLSLSKTTTLLSKAQYSIEKVQKAYRNGVSSVTVDGVKYDVGEPVSSASEIQCESYMSPKDCRVLFNVCDPVVCPHSRCDFGGNYPVTDVVQTGVIGSILLCYPNAVWEGGTNYLPVCTTGVQAGLNSWVNIEESYRDCLQEYLDNGEISGICDKIHSIYACEFFWKQAIPLAKIGVSKATSAISGEGVRGGSEYLSFASALENAKDSVDYFTSYYAAESYNAFKIRSAEEAGSAVCKVSASVVYASGADLLDSLTTPRSPAQYTGSFTETVLTTATNPPQSHYKVSYYIYAGEDQGVTYQVYLKGSSTSYYQDSSSTYIVPDASGYLSAGGYVVKTPDFTAPSGYNTLCISVNGEVECGFDQGVSTFFTENYLTDLYLEEQASAKDITTEKECSSGTASWYSLINPNLQDIVEDLTDTDLYADGITRVCATENPGKETDANWNTEDAVWRDVGYCGDKDLRCWIDTDTVKEAIKTLNIEESALEDNAESYLEYLKESGNYITDSEFVSAVNEIKSESAPDKKIELINEIIDKVFYTNQKAELFLLRGQTYGILAIENLISEEKILVSETEEKEEVETEETTLESSFSLGKGESYEFDYGEVGVSITVSEIDSDELGLKVLIEPISKEQKYGIGDSLKFDLTGDDEWDLELMLEDIENGKGFFSYTLKGLEEVATSSRDELVNKIEELDGTFYIKYSSLSSSETKDIDDSKNIWTWNDVPVLRDYDSCSSNLCSAIAGSLRLNCVYFSGECTKESGETDSTLTCSSDKLTSTQKALCNKATTCRGCNEGTICNCFDGVLHAYEYADVSFSSFKYCLNDGIIDVDTDDPDTSVKESDGCNKNTDIKMSYVEPGDILSVRWGSESSPTIHNVIFLEWVNENEGTAKVFDWIGTADESQFADKSWKSYVRSFRVYELDLKFAEENEIGTVYAVGKPYISETKEEEKEEEEGEGETTVGDDYVSPIFEFREGGVSKNLYYVFYKGKWYWNFDSDEKDLWTSVQMLANSLNEVPDEDSMKFIETLRGKSYEDGLKNLLQRVVEDSEGGVINPKLFTADKVVKFSSDILFTISRDDATDLYFNYSIKESSWTWSPYIETSNRAETCWINCPEIVVPDACEIPVSFKRTPVDENVELIKVLEKDYEEGIIKIFQEASVDSDLEIKEEAYSGKIWTLDEAISEYEDEDSGLLRKKNGILNTNDYSIFLSQLRASEIITERQYVLLLEKTSENDKQYYLYEMLLLKKEMSSVCESLDNIECALKFVENQISENENQDVGQKYSDSVANMVLVDELYFYFTDVLTEEEWRDISGTGKNLISFEAEEKLDYVKELLSNKKMKYCDYEIYRDEYNTFIKFLEDNNLAVEDVECSRINVEDGKIIALTFNDMNIGDVSALGNLNDVTYLNLIDNEISDISALTNIENLEKLGLDNNLISEFPDFTTHENLESLSLDGNNLGEDLYDFVQNLPKDSVLLDTPKKLSLLSVNDNCFSANSNFEYYLSAHSETYFYDGNPRSDC